MHESYGPWHGCRRAVLARRGWVTFARDGAAAVVRDRGLHRGHRRLGQRRPHRGARPATRTPSSSRSSCSRRSRSPRTRQAATSCSSRWCKVCGWLGSSASCCRSRSDRDGCTRAGRSRISPRRTDTLCPLARTDGRHRDPFPVLRTVLRVLRVPSRARGSRCAAVASGRVRRARHRLWRVSRRTLGHRLPDVRVHLSVMWERVQPRLRDAPPPVFQRRSVTAAKSLQVRAARARASRVT